MLVALVASHHNRDLAVLEQLSVGAETLSAALVERCESIVGAAVLPTCNRFEVYLDTDDVATARACALEAIAARAALDLPAVDAALITLTGDDTAQHLMSVASGLESMVVGEREISGQVRRVYTSAHAAGHLSAHLDRLFQSALQVSREVAAHTGLGTSGRSVVSVAFDLADGLREWDGAEALLIGTGALAATGVGLLNARGANVFGVFSPSGRGAEFGELFALDDVPLEDLAGALARADVVLACSGGEGIVLTPTLIAAALKARPRKLTIVDLALHRDVAPGVADMRGVTVVDLTEVAAHAPDESPQSVESARALVAQAVARFGHGEHARVLDPAVVALREHVFGLLETEIAKVRPRPGAPADQVASAEQTEEALRRFARTLLHTPTVRAQTHAKEGTVDQYLDAIRALYGLDVLTPDA